MRTPDTVYWASSGILWVVTLFTVWLLIHYTRRLKATTARAQEAADQEHALEKWARWTMLSVTDRDGMIHAYTIAQLYHGNLREQIWTAPISAGVWMADPDQYGKWQMEAEALLNADQDPTGETGG